MNVDIESIHASMEACIQAETLAVVAEDIYFVSPTPLNHTNWANAVQTIQEAEEAFNKLLGE
jgi:hypothetical protein